MEKVLVEQIEQAIENGDEINVEMHVGMLDGVNVSFVPDMVSEDDNRITIYSGINVFTFDNRDVSMEDDNCFACDGEHCVTIITV